MIVLSLLIFAGPLLYFNWPIKPLPSGTQADRVVVSKRDRSIALYQGTRLIRSYPISLGGAPLGPKKWRGDQKTPEGVYSIIEHKSDSAFHLALRISYPNQNDMDQAKNQGVDPGSDIMIHGMRNGLGLLGRAHRIIDWTAGCIAVTNSEIEQIFQAVPDGTPIEIRE